MDPRDRVDIQGIGQPQPPHGPPAPEPMGPRRPFLQIWYRCCHVYGRLTKSADGTQYNGRCPRCGASLEVPVGEGGTNRRAFEARRSI
ncbi:MAG: hypothetical protein JNL80_09260 [Phycisphaerae bacterium]|nr:hypothetical protein [Phycisphaerae bacterium]